MMELLSVLDTKETLSNFQGFSHSLPAPNLSSGHKDQKGEGEKRLTKLDLHLTSSFSIPLKPEPAWKEFYYQTPNPSHPRDNLRDELLGWLNLPARVKGDPKAPGEKAADCLSPETYPPKCICCSQAQL